MSIDGTFPPMEWIQRYDGFAVASFTLAQATSLARHVHERPHIAIVTRGVLRDSYEDEEQVLRSGEVVAYPQAFAHANVACGSVVIVDFEGTDRYGAAQILRSLRSPRRITAAEAVERFRVAPSSKASELAVAASVLRLVADLADEGRHRGTVADAKRFIEANLADAIGLQVVAAASGYSRFHLARLFRSETGMSVGAYIRSRRVARAARLLATTASSISDVALQCGFFDHAHLANALRSAYGTTPSAWRRRQVDTPPNQT